MASQIFNKEFSTYFMHGEAKSEVRAYLLLQEINKFFLWEAKDDDVEIIKIDEEWDYEVNKFTAVVYYKKYV